MGFVSVLDSHPIGHIEDNLARLAGSNVFSAIDATGAFHVIELTERSKPIIAFATPESSFQFKRLPFGLHSGPSSFARLVKLVMKDVPCTKALSYLDDTITFSDGVDDHFVNLEMVLRPFSSAGLKLKPSKCQLLQHRIDYLGHTVSGQGIAPMPSYFRAVKEWPLPINRKAVRAFLGKIGYYHRFIKDFAKIAEPLSDKLKEDKQAFSILRNKILLYCVNTGWWGWITIADGSSRRTLASEEIKPPSFWTSS